MKLTMPGKSPPSATPSSARTETKEAKPVTKPKHIVNMPQTAVSAGSQIFGDTFFNTKLLGSSLFFRQLCLHRKVRTLAYLAMYVA